MNVRARSPSFIASQRAATRLVLTSIFLLLAMGQVSGRERIRIDNDDIGGVVTSDQGAEAGVWVIAETDDLPNRMAKIVVTDNHGRYVIPDLPAAKYRVWVRGYGLVDSKAVEAKPGERVDLGARTAASPQEAARIYPADYWYSLLKLPSPELFPGTGPEGNGILPQIKTQQDWLDGIKEQCVVCHQLGTQRTREMPKDHPNPKAAWNQRLSQTGKQYTEAQEAGDLQRGGRALISRMTSQASRLGRDRALEMLADWTSRIAAGEVPPAPSRPMGVERNLVVTVWNWGEGHFIHDSVSTDRRNPTVNANGPIFGTGSMSGTLHVFDPATATSRTVKVPGTDGVPWNPDAIIHTPMVDQTGRVWASNNHAEGTLQDYCTNPSNKFAAYFPSTAGNGRNVALYDPKTNKVSLLEVCFTTHHLNFSFDNTHRLFLSGDREMFGWVDTDTYYRTGNVEQSIGWCPWVLDTNGDGVITPDRSQWNEPGQPVDPKKDTRIGSGFPYGLGVSPRDGSVWYANFRPSMPSGILRFEVGKNPPLTCKTEYYTPPRLSPAGYAAFNARGSDVDSNGVVWTAFGSGHVASFDRSKCKITNGPTATGDHCPEGWRFYRLPGPPNPGSTPDQGSADWPYLTWVDHQNVVGLGKDVVYMPGSQSDSIVGFIPNKEKFVTLRIPYPLGTLARSLDARVDDAHAGWKGRGIWTSNNGAVHAHYEKSALDTAANEYSKVIKIQLRPDPLAK